MDVETSRNWSSYAQIGRRAANRPLNRRVESESNIELLQFWVGVSTIPS